MTDPQDVNAVKGSTDDVRNMYEQIPYGWYEGDESPHMKLGVCGLQDTILESVLRNARIMDAGCGAGGQLVKSAEAFPNASFVGVDMTQHSLDLARKIFQEKGLTNIELKQGNLLDYREDGQYDIMMSRGVIHHVENPVAGLKNISKLLKHDGVFVLALYHPFGEFHRMLDREIVSLLRKDGQDVADGKRVLDLLGLIFDHRIYGFANNESKAKGGTLSDDNQTSLHRQMADTDAYLHPIVHTFDWAGIQRLCAGAGFDWVAVDQVFASRNLEGFEEKPGDMFNVYNVDLDHTGEAGSFRLLKESNILGSDELTTRYGTLNKKDQVHLIELMLRPGYMGFVAGRKGSESKLQRRMAGNVVYI